MGDKKKVAMADMEKSKKIQKTLAEKKEEWTENE